MSGKTIYSVCGMCAVRCPIEVDVEDDECRYIQGNRRIPGIRGALCVRGAAGAAALKDDERPQFPMLRKGERGEGKWQRISWDEAFSHAAEKLGAVMSRDGGRGILWSDIGGPFSDLRQAFVRGLGSPNYFTRDSIGAANTHHAALSLFGLTSDRLVYDFRNAREVVLQNRNLFESVNVRDVNDLLDAMENGCKLTVVDVRATVSAAKADRFLLIRPGTDYALNLAVIHVLLSQELYDKSFAENWIPGLDGLKSFVAPYTPEFAEAETGIPAADIVSLSRAMAKAAPKVIWHPGGMTSRYRDSFFVSRSAYIINALLGSIGAGGGLPLAVRPEDLGHGLKRLSGLFPAPSEKRADGVGSKHPSYESGPGLLHLALKAIESGEPYPIKAYVTYQHDPLTELPEPGRLKAVFAKLDFLMCVTSAWTETAWHADLVLPLSSYLERESIVGELDGLKPAFLLRRRCTAPRFETRADWEIISGLSQKLDVKPLSFQSAEDIWRFQLEGTGITIHDLDGRGLVELTAQPQYGRLVPGYRFSTPSGKVEQVSSLESYSSKASPESARYFRLTVGGCSLHVEGHTVNNPLLFRQMPENLLWMNQGIAARLGIQDGDTVSVSSDGHSGRIKVRLNEFVHPEAVFMVRGFGRTLPVESRARGKGLADNLFMPGGLDQEDPVGGGLALQEHFVTVRKEPAVKG